MKKRHKKQGRDKDQAGVLARPSWCFGKTELVFWQDRAGVKQAKNKNKKSPSTKEIHSEIVFVAKCYG
jgi:hypothetical protein